MVGYASGLKKSLHATKFIMQTSKFRPYAMGSHLNFQRSFLDEIQELQ